MNYVHDLDAKAAKIAAEHIRDTIERCAQMAEEMAPEPDGAPDFVWTKADTKLLNLATGIAAAIRKLKDRPQIDPNLQYPGKDPDFVFPEE